MAPTSGKQTHESAEQRVEEEALRVARSIQAPGQTKEQTRLIAKGIEKGIALYKQQQGAKLRERDRQRKKAAKLKAREREETQELEIAEEFGDGSAAVCWTLWAGAALFGIGALLHLLRFVLGTALIIGTLAIDPVWSLAAAAAGATIAVWLGWLGARLR
jgi:hypothetical protein